MNARTIGLIFFFYPILFLQSLSAQDPVRESLFTDVYTINPGKEGKLDLCIDNISFLNNTETGGDIQKGYTLPGIRINPRLIYYPASMIKLEAGISLLKYWGADKYPNYAYRNIPEWKAPGYQLGFHLLPFFRAQIQPVPQLNIVLGHIYGGSNHGLIEPLYNPELNLSADPEMGAQIIYNSKIAHFDAWINWETFTFKNEANNEVVTTGASACFHITNPQSFFYIGVPIQAVVTHHGGEIDTVNDEVTSMANGATGLQFGFNFDNPVFKHLRLSLMGAAYKNLHSKEPLLFDQGWAAYSNLDIRIWNLDLKMNIWRSGNFINLFGNPIFGNVSTSKENWNFPRIMVWNPGLSYEQKFGAGLHFGANFELFSTPEFAEYEGVAPIKTGKYFGCSTGLFLRINPSIVLKK
ncbi:MAG: hypothetical protein LBC48_07605 [Dysgonamonadaceae bacterium]|jgi:hypothetical protein|nr:hypothetical protein [Dysgonamonadaceae bacterium]